MITLALDASTYTGDVAVLSAAGVLAETSTAMKGATHEGLMPAVADTLRRAGVAVAELQRVVCGAGPGSFTSLRIAGAIAKGVALGVGCPLVAVPSLALVVAGEERAPGRYLAVMDALRGEYHAGVYEVDVHGEVTETARARLISAAEVAGLARELDATMVGPVTMAGVAEARPRARGVARLETLLAELGAVDLAAWEPEYGRAAEAQVRWEAAHGRALPR